MSNTIPIIRFAEILVVKVVTTLSAKELEKARNPKSLTPKLGKDSKSKI